MFVNFCCCLYLCLQVINLFFLCSWGSLFVLFFISSSELCSFFLDIYIFKCCVSSLISLCLVVLWRVVFTFCFLYSSSHVYVPPLPSSSFSHNPSPCCFVFSICLRVHPCLWLDLIVVNRTPFVSCSWVFLFSGRWSSSSLSSMTPSSEIQLEEPETLAISTNERSSDEADVFFSIKSSSEIWLPRSHGVWHTCIIRKVFHTDLKPRNVLVSSNSNHITVKIADFGLSQEAQLHGLDTRGFTNRRMFTGIVGTTPYMSNQIIYMPPNPLTNKPPESMCAEYVNLSVSPKIIPGFYSAKVDVYSFAVTCAEILTGQPPFMDIPRLQFHLSCLMERGAVYLLI